MPKTFDLEGYEVEVDYDTGEQDSPRNGDNLGTIRTASSRYAIGDEICSSFSPGKGRVYLEVWAVIHGGIQIATEPIPNPYMGLDSGILGYIYVEPEKIREWFGVKRITQALRERVKEQLKAEVEVLNAYLNGMVYRFTIRKDGEIVESCGGYYDEIDCEYEARCGVFSLWDKEFPKVACRG